MPNINIRVLWDDDCANIKKDYETDTLKVKVTSNLYQTMDPLFKLDFMSDMEEWVQEEIDRIHEQELNENEKFTYSYIMRTPKSSKQLKEERENPKLIEERKKLAFKIREENSKRLFGNNIIQFNKNTND